MIIPQELILAIENYISKVSFDQIKKAAKELSNRYRGKSNKQDEFIQNETELLAYLCLRMPSTYAAIYYVLKRLYVEYEIDDVRSIIDFGSGTGAGFWASHRLFDDLSSYTFVEVNDSICKAALHLIESLEHHVGLDVINKSYTEEMSLKQHDLSLFSYTLSENTVEDQKAALDLALGATNRFLVIIEPGTKAGYDQLMIMRDYLLSKGLHLLAPCPHNKKCPKAPSDWCHFYQRLPRASFQKNIKDGSLGYEDEKFSYLIFSKNHSRSSGNRIIEFPNASSTKVDFTICSQSGKLEKQAIEKRNKQLFKKAKKLDWGDLLVE